MFTQNIHIYIYSEVVYDYCTIVLRKLIVTYEWFSELIRNSLPLFLLFVGIFATNVSLTSGGFHIAKHVRSVSLFWPFISYLKYRLRYADVCIILIWQQFLVRHVALKLNIRESPKKIVRMLKQRSRFLWFAIRVSLIWNFDFLNILMFKYHVIQ